MKLSYWHYGIIVSSLATAFLHISLYPYFGWFVPFVLNGVGSLVLLAAYFLPIPFFQQRHHIVYWSIAGYTLLTILLCVILGDKTFLFATTAAIAYYAKIADIFLLVFMGYDLQGILQTQKTKELS